MASNPSALLALAESVADRTSVDWNSAEDDAGDARAVVRQLRILADLAMVHRTLPVEPADLPTTPAPSRSQDVASTHANGTGVDRERTTIGQWAHLSLLERIGSGAHGEVYCAWDRYLERRVAVKLLRFADGFTDPLASTISKEGRLLARVRHPNVITVYGVAVHDQRVGLWMELIQGTTLEQILSAHGPSSAREAALVGIDLCRALAALHGAGLIHRDIKAQNVMREDGGRIVLMDLGTGREMAPTSAAQLSDLAGTPLYIAPEIFEGASASVRSDIYSLGVLLYHLVTANYPVRATTILELRDAHRSPRTGLRDARADLPTAFVRVVDRATSRNPEQRHASAGALEADLAHALDEAASHRVAAPPLPPRVRRLPALGAAIAVGVALAAVATLTWGAIGHRWPWLRAAAPAPVRSIAVLPLANLSGDPEQEYFADGMAEDIITALSHFRQLFVIARNSSFTYKGCAVDVKQVGRELGVRYVLEGSVRKAANRVRITGPVSYTHLTLPTILRV